MIMSKKKKTDNIILMHKSFNQNLIELIYQESPIVPVTFLSRPSHARIKSYEGAKKLNISLSFRTYEDRGLLAHHKFLTNGYVKVVYRLNC